MTNSSQPGSQPDSPTYADAGVSVEAGEQAVELIKPHAKRATRPEVRGDLGGFAGLFALGKYREPLLASGSDGVGTKLAVAQAMDKHDTIGIDLVAMCVDDLICCGAEPLFLQDYLAIGKVYPEKVADIVGGIAEGCVTAGCALLGGETAEHPGVMGENDYDVSATAVGVVEADDVLGPERSMKTTSLSRWHRLVCTPMVIRWRATSCWSRPTCHLMATWKNSAALWAKSFWNLPAFMRKTAWN